MPVRRSTPVIACHAQLNVFEQRLHSGAGDAVNDDHVGGLGHLRTQQLCRVTAGQGELPSPFRVGGPGPARDPNPGLVPDGTLDPGSPAPA